jgi:hypothetical protein
MNNGRLVLQAPLGSAPPQRDALLSRLGDSGLIGDPYAPVPDAWLAGPGFLQQISFLGCSPHLRLEPPAEGGSDFCHVRLRGPYRPARLLSAGSSRPPRCPACGSGVKSWRPMEAAWSVGRCDSRVTCENCGERAGPERLHWRRSAGFGTLFVEIWGVYPEEAIPQQSLLQLLGGNEGCWRYFYLLD